MAIEYPINLETDRFTVYDTNTNQPIVDGNGKAKTGVKWASVDVTKMIPNLAPNIKWLIEVKETAPSYDSSTQRLEKTKIYDVEAETVTDGYSVINLTQEEIDAAVPPHYETVSLSQAIKLAVGESDQNAFSRMNVLIDLSGMAGTDEIGIKDIYGVTHTITVDEFKTEMVGYGQYCYSLFLSA